MITIEIQVRGTRETATIRLKAISDCEGEVMTTRREVEKLALGLLYHGMNSYSSETGFAFKNFIRKGSGQEVDICYRDETGSVHRLYCPRLVCEDIANIYSGFAGGRMSFEYNH